MPVDMSRLNLHTVQPHGAESGNLLIRGENLAVMRALLPTYAGRVKLVYIDPPFNTGGRFDHYQDDLSSETWLAMMEERLPLLRDFLRPDGVVFVHLDDAEMAYCKAAMDRIIGRENYITTIVAQSATPSSFKTVNPGPVDVTEYVLMYCRERASFKYESAYVPCANVDLKRFSRYITNFAAPPAEWRFAPVSQGALAGSLFAGGKELEKAMGRLEARTFLRGRAEEFALANAERVFETKTLQRPGRRLAEEIARSRKTPGVIRVARSDRPDLHLYRGRQLYFLGQSVREIEGRRTVVQPLSNLWTDIPTSNLFAEGGVAFRYGKKPERLLARILETATAPGDLVLDAFAGSGTTGAVAHKLGRRWIMIEHGAQAETHALARMRRVVDGEDHAGISAAVGWRGGGGFVYGVMDEAASGQQARAPGPRQKTAEHPVAPPLLVVAAVIREGRRVFLAQRADNSLWEFPGGKVRPGEDARVALRREIREELGLEIEVGEPLEVASVLHPRYLVLIFFAARILSGEPQRLDCADFRWIDADELDSLPLAEGDKIMRERLGRMLNYEF